MARLIAILSILGGIFFQPLYAAETSKSDNNSNSLDIRSLKKDYWHIGEAKDLKVVQNRIYTKQYRPHLAISYGSINHDPFLDVTTLGGLLGFSVSEFFSIQFMYWKALSTRSAASAALQDASGYGANSNPIDTLVGGELNASIIYGKMDLLGQLIAHFETNILLGGGQLTTQNGVYMTPWIGLGLQLYLNRNFTFRADYRILRYSENIVELFRPAALGQVLLNRVTYAGTLMLGLNFLL